MANGLTASWKISKLITNICSPHSVGENIVLPPVSKILSDLMHMNPSEAAQSIPISNSTIFRRIDDMVQSIESTFFSLLQSSKFSLHVYECTLPANDLLLMTYVQFFLI